LFFTALKAKVSSFESAPTRFPPTKRAVSPAVNTGLSCELFSLFPLLEEPSLLDELDELPLGFCPIFSCCGCVDNTGKNALLLSLKYPMENSRRVEVSTVPTRTEWEDSTFCIAKLPDGSTSAVTLRRSAASPWQVAIKQLSERYSSKRKKSSASKTLFCAVFSPRIIRWQKTSFGYQPVFALISSNACATVSPRLTSCTVSVDLPCFADCGMAICEVKIKVSSSLSIPTAITMAVLCTSTSPKSPETNKNKRKVRIRR
jgi:hypothetical protein